MKHLLKEVFVAIVFGYVLIKIQAFFNSQYIIIFLKQNLILLLVALLAINCTTLGVVLTKIRELIDKTKGVEGFVKTRKAMLQSIHEQIALVIVSLVLLVIQDSIWILGHCQLLYVAEILIMSCFVYALLVLYDTACSVFVLLDYKG
jgi:hypothetical protein